jgi:hypothetical protein
VRRSFKFTATVTDKTGATRQVNDTANFDHPVSKADALTAIRNELNRQGTPGTGIQIVD